MEKFSQKWAVVALLDSVAEGSEFYFTDIPLHVTLAGVFKIDYNGIKLSEELSELISDQEPFTITVGERDMFGPAEDVSVMRIIKSPELLALYNKIHTWLVQSGAEYNEPHYEGLNFLPHSTVQKSALLHTGEVKHIKSVSIIDLLPNGDGYQRKVFKTIHFK